MPKPVTIESALDQILVIKNNGFDNFSIVLKLLFNELQKNIKISIEFVSSLIISLIFQHYYLYLLKSI